MFLCITTSAWNPEVRDLNHAYVPWGSLGVMPHIERCWNKSIICLSYKTFQGLVDQDWENGNVQPCSKQWGLEVGEAQRSHWLFCAHVANSSYSKGRKYLKYLLSPGSASCFWFSVALDFAFRAFTSALWVVFLVHKKRPVLSCVWIVCSALFQPLKVQGPKNVFTFKFELFLPLLVKVGKPPL